MLHFTIKLTNDSNGKTYFAEVPCLKIEQAHECAERIRIPGETIRIYPTIVDEAGNDIIDGIEAGALTILKRSTANMIKRGIKDQNRLKRVSVSKNSYEWTIYTESRRDKITFADAEDILSIARLALIEAIRSGYNIERAYSFAYSEVNKHICKQGRVAKITSYIEDPSTGEIVNVNREICRLIKPGDSLTFTVSDNLDADTHDNSMEAVDRFIAQLTGELTRTQQDVLRLLAYGWSQRQIADYLNRSIGTVTDHIKKIRQAAFKICPGGFSEFAEFFKN